MKGSGPKFIKLVSAPTDESVQSGGRPRKICYVDDSRTSAYITKKILTEFGYHVDHFSSAEPAIVALLESDYDLLLTDLLLSTGGMDGDDLVRFLRMSGHPKKKLLPVIVITGSSDKDTLLKIYEAGANGVLVKPITGEELHDRIRTLIPDPPAHGPQPGEYTLEIHEEQAEPEAPVKPERRKATERRGISRKGVPSDAAPKGEPRAEAPDVASGVDAGVAPAVEQPPPGANEEPAPAIKPPVRAFGAKKRVEPDRPERDAASVIAELRAQARAEEDEDIPTLTLALEPTGFRIQPLGDEQDGAEAALHAGGADAAPEATPMQEPVAERPRPARRPPEAVSSPAEPPVPGAASDDVIVLSSEGGPAEDSGPVLDLNEPAPKPKPTRAAPAAPPVPPAPEPATVDDLISGDKAIITALDISQDFSNVQDDFYQPSISQTVIETIKRYKVLTAAALVSLLIIGWSMLGFVGGGGTSTVDTVRAEVGELHQTISVPGKVVSKLRVDVIATTTGQVTQVIVKDGDKVRKGQSLAQIENEELASEVKRAEGNLLTAQEEFALAEKTVMRMRRALELGAVSRQAVEEAEAGLRSAQAKVTVAREQARSSKSLVDKLTVTAPIDGTVTAKNIQPGQYVKTNDVMFSIVDLAQREIEAKVDATDSSLINVGQEVVVSSDAAPNRKWSETVTRVATAANREAAANTVNVYFSLTRNTENLKLGQQVDSEIRIVSSDNAVKLPIGALIQRNGKSWVAVIEDGRAHFVPVNTGMEDLTHVEITDGIRAGQEVVIPRGGTLREGDKVTAATAAR
jgi:RND family efflux transporter MFP subunit